MDASRVLSRLKEGGVPELTTLFMQHRDSLRKVIALRLDPRLYARVDASDIVQETYVRAVKALSAYLSAPTIHPVVWLRLIGKRLVAETHRKHFRNKRSPDHELAFNLYDDPLVNHLADSLPSAGSVVADREILSKIQRLMHQLPLNDREILEMRHLESMSITEISTSLDISYESAKKRYQRAFQRFRKMAGSMIDSAEEQ